MASGFDVDLLGPGLGETCSPPMRAWSRRAPRMGVYDIEVDQHMASASRCSAAARTG